jgi:outer membrane lipoprotein carrier protein
MSGWRRRGLAPVRAVVTGAVLACLAGDAPLAAQGTTTAAGVLARARREYATVRTARAEFTQEIRNPLTARTLRSRGTLWQQKPGRLAVTFSEPAGDRIVSDGRTLWVFLPSSTPGQVLRMPAGDGGTGGVDLAATVLEAPTEGYVVTTAGSRSVEGHPCTGVSLVGEAGASVPFPRATVWIDDATAQVREVAVTDAQGVTRTIRIVSFVKNVAVPDSVFRFVPPPGVRVVDAP